MIGILILIQRPEFGLIGVLLGNYFVEYTGPGGINATVLGIMGIAGLWIIDMVVQKKKIYFVEPRTTQAIFGLFGSAFISFFVGQLLWQPLAPHAPLTAQIGGLTILIISGLAFLVQGNLISDLKWLKLFTWIFVVIGSLYTIGRMSPPVSNILRRVFAEEAFTGSLFFVWILAFSFSQAALNRKLHFFWRIALFTLFLGVLYISIGQASDWKSGYIPPLAGVVIIIALILRWKVVWISPLLLVGAWFVIQEALSSDQYSVMTRLQAWEIVFELSKTAPLFGTGFSNYYWYTPLIPINGWQVNFSSHNQYMDIFAQMGLVGLFCYFWVFWEIARIGVCLRDKVPEGFAKAYVYGALGGLAGTLIAGLFVDWVLPFTYNIGMNGLRSSILSWLFLGGLIVIHRTMKESGNSIPASGGEND